MIVRSGEQSALIILMQRRIHPKIFIGDVEKNIHFNYTGILCDTDTDTCIGIGRIRIRGYGNFLKKPDTWICFTIFLNK